MRRTLPLVVLAVGVVTTTGALAAQTGSRYTLTVAVRGSGTTTSGPRGIACPPTCHASFVSGARVQLVAHPRAGWTFVHWLRGCKGATACSVRLTASKSVLAVFGKVQAPPPPPPPSPPPPPPPSSGAFALTSSAFVEGDAIPATFKCGGGKSPPLAWSSAPAGTKSFAIVLDDPDAVPQPNTTFTHWITWNIAADASGLAQGQNGPVSGTNDTGGTGYFGPCPPAGTGVHHYHFHLYALSSSLALAAGSSRPDFEAAIAGKVIEEIQLVGIAGS